MQDKKCLRICRGNIQRAVSWYYIASYAYYVEDNPLVSDATFEKIAQMLIKANLKDCPISMDTLKAGTYLGEYPGWVPGVVELLRKEDDDE